MYTTYGALSSEKALFFAVLHTGPSASGHIRLLRKRVQIVLVLSVIYESRKISYLRVTVVILFAEDYMEHLGNLLEGLDDSLL